MEEIRNDEIMQDSDGVVLAQITAAISDINTKTVPSMVANYAGKDSWSLTFTRLADDYRIVWEGYLTTFAEMRADRRGRVIEALTRAEELRTRLQTGINNENTRLLTILKESLASACLTRRKKLETAQLAAESPASEPTEKVEIPTDEPKAPEPQPAPPVVDLDSSQQQLARINVELAGDEKAHVDLPKRTQKADNFMAAMVLLGFAGIAIAVEVLSGGYDMWRVMSNPRMAWGFTAAFQILPVILAFFLAGPFKRSHTHNLAKTRFRSLYSKGHPQGYRVGEFEDTALLKILGWPFIGLTLFPVIYRLYVATTQDFGTAGFVSALAGFFVTLTAFGVKYAMSKRYTDEQYERLAERKKAAKIAEDEEKKVKAQVKAEAAAKARQEEEERKEAEAMAAALPKPIIRTPQEEFDQSFNAAVAAYRNGVSAKLQIAGANIESRETARLEIVALAKQRNEVRGELREGFYHSCIAVMDGVQDTHHVKRAHIQFGNGKASEYDYLMSFFDAAVKLPDDEKEMAQIRDGEIEISLDDPTAGVTVIEDLMDEAIAATARKTIVRPANAVN
ncbi:MAG: hypothetical protein A2751_01715 [Candidatus Doudnabacteria bacterium RIFCSPHIGHO2_01_FULL_46_14]|uniref:Uncharacterized protein n=1 Tax=Candidatus Doudnabacteria bacterium RIFCSPHIGHO2_01_FULL_46_14 TaxID=1817824 RepID=A0A1F5NJL6_9BACT|nr:MAG: hypothetical protein A2751_01715 [Candidatus Doudnabacteria bacterium RIFCSPHIGHO2_01_FULL_46_14]